MNKEQLKEVGKSLLSFSEDRIPEMKDWISNFTLTGRCPNGQKENLSKLKTIKDACNLHDQYGLYSTNIEACLSYWDENEIDRIVDSFVRSEKITKFECKGVTFINESAMSEKVFLGKCKELVGLITTLDGFHKKALEGNPKIVFKPNAEMRTHAKYHSDGDAVWVKQSAKADNELYGHLKYLVVHELGHRFEHKLGLPEDFWDNGFRTTTYSYTDGFAGSEAFAEVFAISHWRDKYEKHADVIDKFNRVMNQSFNLNTEKTASLGL